MLPTLIDVERVADDKEYRDDLRHLCQTDLFFLAPFVGFHDFREDIHGPVKELYVQKKPGLPIDQQDTIKNRMHLDPRHTYKTSAGVVDVVQWIITCPNVTIVNETATQKLANALTERQAHCFVKPKTKPPTIFHQLFPEYVVSKVTSTYRAPCATEVTVEPTIGSTSPGSSQSGWHPWILNPDDVADTENSGIDATDASRDKIWNSYQTNLNTLRHGGYQNIRGTRYHPFDIYGRTLRAMDPSLWKVLIRGSFIVNSGDRLVEGEFPREDELTMLFPGLLSYSMLREKYFTDYRSFMCQQMNDPQGGGVATFPPNLFDQAQIEDLRIPTLGTTRICWRFASEAKSYMKHYSVGVAMRTFGTRTYVVDAWRGVYTPSELAERVVNGCRKHQTGDLTIEQTPGAEYLLPHIQNEALHKNLSLKIDQVAYETDDTRRKARIAQMEPLMRSGRVWFSTGSNQKEQIRTQFIHFGLIEDNGFPDIISRLALRMPVSVIQSHLSEAQKEARRDQAMRSVWDSLHSHGGTEVVDQVVLEEQRRIAMARAGGAKNSYGLRDVLGGLDG